VFTSSVSSSTRFMYSSKPCARRGKKGERRGGEKSREKKKRERRLP